MSPKPQLGKRHTCHACGTKYYDLGREEPLCPKCGASLAESPEPDPRTLAMAKLKAESRLGRRADRSRPGPGHRRCRRGRGSGGPGTGRRGGRGENKAEGRWLTAPWT